MHGQFNLTFIVFGMFKYEMVSIFERNVGMIVEIKVENMVGKVHTRSRCTDIGAVGLHISNTYQCNLGEYQFKSSHHWKSINFNRHLEFFEELLFHKKWVNVNSKKINNSRWEIGKLLKHLLQKD
jgi:hypothetical protein